MWCTGLDFLSLAAFCVVRPPYGLGYDAEMVEAIQIETRDLLLGQVIADVRSRREHIQIVAQQTTGEVLPDDGSIHSGNASQFANHTQAARVSLSTFCGTFRIIWHSRTVANLIIL
jgi:hypothetical protein